MPQPTLMNARLSCVTAALLFLVILTGSKLWAQGPPYQTDDPVPVDLHHYEFYIFGSADGTPVEIFGSSLRVQLGRAAEGASARGVAVGRGGAAQQSCISTEGNRAY
jgi:hypothetical protein